MKTNLSMWDLKHQGFLPISSISKSIPISLAKKYCKYYETLNQYKSPAFYFDKEEVKKVFSENLEAKDELILYKKTVKHNSVTKERIDNVDVSYQIRVFDGLKYINETKTLKGVSVDIKGCYVVISTKVGNEIKKHIKKSNVVINKYA